MASTIDNKGWVTLPKAVRDLLGVKVGSAVDFELTPDGEVVLVKVAETRPPSRFEVLRGCAGPGLGTDELMMLIRGAYIDA